MKEWNTMTPQNEAMICSTGTEELCNVEQYCRRQKLEQRPNDLKLSEYKLCQASKQGSLPYKSQYAPTQES